MTISKKSQSTIRHRTQGHLPKVLIHPAQDCEMLNTPPYPNNIIHNNKQYMCDLLDPNLNVGEYHHEAN